MASAARIQVLPAELANQIAAGEVVERPASVVRELVENALDAGAGRVDVAIEAGGRKLIRVVDDGSGIVPGDVRLAFERHATSKLTRVEDLFALRTLGFRGEALPSIAAVSRTTLSTRAAGLITATVIDVTGGEVGEPRDAGSPDGTRIDVRDLFYNVPARLKFLKGGPTETAHVVDVVLRLALANPAVHFRLSVDGREALNLPPEKGRAERARGALGRRLGADLFAIPLSRVAGVEVEAYVGAPEQSRTTARGLHLFVNRRPVRDRGLLYAVSAAFGPALERGRYPVGVVFIELEPQHVDVNVHPQKSEVRFSQPAEVYAGVRRALRSAMADAPWLIAALNAAGVDADGSSDSAAGRIATGQTPSEPHNRELWERPAFERRLAPAADENDDGDSGWLADAPLGRDDSAAPGRATAEIEPVYERAPAALPAAEERGCGRVLDEATALASTPVGRSDGVFARLDYLGQLSRLYLVCRHEDGLVLVDQHAAHERILFERLRSAHVGRAVPVQRLLVPEVLELAPAEAVVAEAAIDALGSLGVELAALGMGSFAVRGIPAAAARAPAGRLVRDLLEELSGDAGAGGAAELVARSSHAVLARIACHAAVRAGEPLGPGEARSLLGSLDVTPRRDACPHGRPTSLRLTLTELGRRFGRL